MTRLTLLLLVLLAAPLSAQTLARAVPPVPVGYWSLTTPATNPETGQPMQVVVLVRFKADGTFLAVLKTWTEGEPDVGSVSPFRGQWERQVVFGKPMICVKRPDMDSGVCVYGITAEGLSYVNRPLKRHTAESVATIAPELVGPEGE